MSIFRAIGDFFRRRSIEKLKREKEEIINNIVILLDDLDSSTKELRADMDKIRQTQDPKIQLRAIAALQGKFKHVIEDEELIKTLNQLLQKDLTRIIEKQTKIQQMLDRDRSAA